MSKAEQRETASGYELWCVRMLLSKCKLWYSFPQGCVDSEKRFQTNGAKRIISHECSAWHFHSHRVSLDSHPLLKGLLLYDGRPISLSEGISPFFTEPPAMQAALNRSLIICVYHSLYIWELYYLYPKEGYFLRMKRGTKVISRH